MYNEDNIFAKILRGELPSKKVFEDEAVLAFYDIHPKAKVHVIVIPKLQVTSFQDFTEKSNEKEIGDFFKKVKYIAIEVLKLDENFKLLVNNGVNAGQEVFHFHMHILSNKS